jgi:hypothetical protein
MDFHDEDKAGRVDGSDSALSAEFSRILDNARKQLEDEFRRRLEAATQQANDTATTLLDNERERAIVDARTQLTAQLRAQFEQTLQHNTARLESDFEDRINASVKEWEAEKARLLEQMDIWRAYAEAQRQMAESHTQAEILGFFLDRAEPFAANLAVYVARPDGLALWKTRGGAEFPQVVSRETIDPDAYFKTIVVRDKIVAAVCARQPLKPESLDFLSGALSRAIEAFGMRLQNRAPVSAS